MTDIISREERSRHMASIRSRDTQPEVYLRKLLFSRGLRYRIAEKKVPGSPDIFLRRYNTAIFVHGCFWHQHKGCKMARVPKSNTPYWEEKFAKNAARDARVVEELAHQGIKCLIVWECTIRRMRSKPEVEKEVLDACLAFLESDKQYMEL